MSKGKLSKPIVTLEEKEDELISLAVDLAEKQLREGTAPSQIISHYLKLGSTRERIERERIESENKLAQAKAQAMINGEELQRLYEDAIKAFGIYSGKEDYGDEYEYTTDI